MVYHLATQFNLLIFYCPLVFFTTIEHGLVVSLSIGPKSAFSLGAGGLHLCRIAEQIFPQFRLILLDLEIYHVILDGSKMVSICQDFL
jgi:hypothetical protein